MLSESTRNWIMQIAADKVTDGTEPNPEEFRSQEEVDVYNNTVRQLTEFAKKYGKEKLQQTTVDVGYDY